MQLICMDETKVWQYIRKQPHWGLYQETSVRQAKGAYGSPVRQRKVPLLYFPLMSPSGGWRSQNAALKLPVLRCLHGQRAGDEAWVLGSFPGALQEVAVYLLCSESARHLLSRTTTLRLATEVGCSLDTAPIPAPSPQTVPSLFPVCGHLCYAYGNTNSMRTNN